METAKEQLRDLEGQVKEQKWKKLKKNWKCEGKMKCQHLFRGARNENNI